VGKAFCLFGGNVLFKLRSSNQNLDRANRFIWGEPIDKMLPVTFLNPRNGFVELIFVAANICVRVGIGIGVGLAMALQHCQQPADGMQAHRRVTGFGHSGRDCIARRSALRRVGAF